MDSYIQWREAEWFKEWERLARQQPEQAFHVEEPARSHSEAPVQPRNPANTHETAFLPSEWATVMG